MHMETVLKVVVPVASKLEMEDLLAEGMTDVNVLAIFDAGRTLAEAAGAETEVWRTSLNAGHVPVLGKLFRRLKMASPSK